MIWYVSLQLILITKKKKIYFRLFDNTEQVFFEEVILAQVVDRWAT